MSSRITTENVTVDIFRLQCLFVNCYFVGEPDRWLLIDAGFPGFANHIVKAAEERFGPGAEPQAIVLTHGHLDHVGALPELLKHWDVPVYVHAQELPYLLGQKEYPVPTSSPVRRAMSAVALANPNRPSSFARNLRLLPENCEIPNTPAWRWIHTPGHTPGHVSLFRDSDRSLVVGDAFVTVKPVSLNAIVRQERGVHEPSAYFTSDWTAAQTSVAKIAGLRPATAATGHGGPIYGVRLSEGLDNLVASFD